MNAKNDRIMTPEENYEAASLELAVYRMLKRDDDIVKASLSKKDESELLQAAEESASRMLDFIDKQMKRNSNRTSRRDTGFRVLKIVAVFVLIFNMGLTIAAMASNNVRAKVIEFLTEINESYISMRFSETGEDAIVPDGWLESYYPTYIPEGFFIKQYLPHDGNNMVIYEDGEGNTLSIKVCDTDTFASLNTAGAEITYISLHGVTAIVLNQPYNEVNIIWAVGDRYFVINGNDYETVLAVAESIEIVMK